MSNHRIRYGAISGFALAVLLITAFALDMAVIGSTGGNPVFDPDNIGPDLLRAQGSTIWLVEGWLYTLLVVAAPMFYLAVYWTMKKDDDRGLPAVGLVAAAGFWIFETLHNVSIVTVLSLLVPGYTGDGSTAELAGALIKFANVNFTFGLSVGLVFLIGSLFSLGAATLRGRRLPKWTGYVALASSSLMLISLPGGQAVIAGLVGWLLFIAWVTGASVSMART